MNEIIYLWEWYDSNVYSEYWIVRKYYQETLTKILQDNLWWTTINIITQDELKAYHELMNELSKFTFNIKNFTIHWNQYNITIKFLEVWNKITEWCIIENKRKVLITEVPLIEWENVSKISFLNHNICLLFKEIWLTIWYLRIAPYNIKIIDYNRQEKHIELLITDFANNIKEFVNTQNINIRDRISKNRKATYTDPDIQNNFQYNP